MSWWLLGWVACTAEGPAPLVVAHGGGAAYWPPNSRTAVEGAIALELDAIELGVALTGDEVPVLATFDTIDPTWCEGPLDGATAIADLGFDQLQAEVLCGGVPDPRFDQALVVAEPLLPLDGLLELLRAASGELQVHLRPLGEPERAAAAVLDRWVAQDLPQDLVIVGDAPVLEAFDVRGRELGFDHRSVLLLREDELEAQRLTGQLDYARQARDAGADAVGLPADLVDVLLLRSARAEGVPVHLRDVDDLDALARWSRPGVADAVVTDWPGDVP